jgi:hypothetical protein
MAGMVITIFVCIDIFIFLCAMLYCLLLAAVTGELFYIVPAMGFCGVAVYVLRWIRSWHPPNRNRES